MAGGEGKSEAPIIIKKGKHGHGHHGGAWKVAYADFVTAMMALFIVLWILGQSEEVKKAVSSYFKDPVGFESGQGIGVADGKKNMIPNVVEEKQPGDATSAEQAKVEQEKLKEMSEQILQELRESPEFKELAKYVEATVTEEGLRLELLESSNDVFFEIGTSRLNAKAQQLLKTIGAEFAKMPNRVVIEGHTDARPFQNLGQGYTNYELSADRANAARRSLQAGGLKEGQIAEIRGYADKKLKNANDPFDLVNRRISIIVKYPGAQ